MSDGGLKSARRGGSRQGIARPLSELTAQSARDQRNDDACSVNRSSDILEDATTTIYAESDTTSVPSRHCRSESFISGSLLRLSYETMSQHHKENKWPELLKRLCAHMSPDPETADKRYQVAQKLLKGRKSTGFDNTYIDENLYIEKIREHLRRSKNSGAADKFLTLSGRLSLLSSSKKDYIFYRTALYSFLLALGSGIDDTSASFVVPAAAQTEKLNELLNRRRVSRPVSRPLSTPCALPYRNGQQNVSVAPLLDDGQRDKSVIRNILNLLVARGPEQILKMKEEACREATGFQYYSELHCRIAAAEEVANNLVQLTQFQLHSAKSRSLVVQRLAEALDNQIIRHKHLVALLEQMNTQGKLSLARLDYLCLQPDNLIYLLSDVCNSFIQRANILSGNQVLDALYVQAACSPQASSQYEIANALLRHCLQPWLAMLRAWMLRGQLANTKWDLFVHDVGRDGVSNLWYDKFTIQKDHVPAFLNEDDTRKILSVGKAMVFLKEADDVHRVAEIQRQLAHVMGVEDKSSAVEFRTEAGDVDQECSAKRIEPNMDPRGFLRFAYKLAMQRMKTVILEKFHLKTHLLLIRNVVLLYDGVFSKALLSNLSDELSESSGGTLTEVERSEVIRMVYRLLPELPEVEASAFIGVHFDGGSGGPITLESFGLKYKLREPLSYVLQNKSFVFYNRIFAHLFRVRKFSFLFTELSAELQMVRPKTNQESNVLSQCRLLLHEVMNFVLNLESYQFAHVVTTAWGELERRIDAMTSVDDLSDAHNAFVENLLRGLFLEGEDTAGNHLRYRNTMLEFLRILSEHEDDKMVQFLWMNFDFNLFYSDKHYALIMSVTAGHRKMLKTNKSVIMSSMSASDIGKAV
ncbi:gamma-tubulin complex component 3-like isoform X3 [Varroa destructor]|uniref:Gamma-tubulin complex component n=1 Tax=Varroa destructor TaxID=109461 RepID=A0A7M7K1X9_VARDE|nr:gamma-tubulin complex component 3-like isoform X3 [Varroa destructor]